jgi:trimeric autotransporter adhesin
MAIDTKPNLNSCKFEQLTTDSLILSGCTKINITGIMDSYAGYKVSGATIFDAGNILSSLQIGCNACTYNDYNIAIGASSIARISNSIAIGRGSIASGNTSIAIGCDTDAIAGYSIGIGNTAQSTGVYSIALGSNSSATNTNSIAIGLNSIACATNTIAIGGYSQANGLYSISIGCGSKSYNCGISIGLCSGGNATGGINNIGIGYQALFNNTSGCNNIANGYQAGYLNLSGSSNIFLGTCAGYNETGSSKLYIANNANKPLLYGEFDNEKLCIRGKLYVSGLTNSIKPDVVYYDSSTNELTYGTLPSGGTNIGASGEKISKLINQPSHGFTVGTVLGWSGGAYNKPIANGLYDGEVLGIVSKCYNTSCFDLTQAGYVTGLTSLSANTTYFLSDTIAGLLTPLEPTIGGHIAKTMLIADTSTSAWVLPYPGYVVTTGSSGGGTVTGANNGLTLSGADILLGGTLIQNTAICLNNNTIGIGCNTEPAYLEIIGMNCIESAYLQANTNSFLNIHGVSGSEFVDLSSNFTGSTLLNLGGIGGCQSACLAASPTSYLSICGASSSECIILRAVSNSCLELSSGYAGLYGSTVTGINVDGLNEIIAIQSDANTYLKLSGGTASILGNLKLLTTPTTGICTDSVLVWNSTDKSIKKLPYSSGGTGGSSLSVFTITGDSSATGFTINHAKNKQFVGVEIVRNTSPYPTVYTSVYRTNANCVCVTFDTAPTTGLEYKILITS